LHETRADGSAGVAVGLEGTEEETHGLQASRATQEEEEEEEEAKKKIAGMKGCKGYRRSKQQRWIQTARLLLSFVILSSLPVFFLLIVGDVRYCSTRHPAERVQS
jgi:hypothetical protein